MSRLVREIAMWEFRRFFKLRDQLIMLLIGLLIGAGFNVAQKWVRRSGREPVRVIVLSVPARTLAAPAGSSITFEPAGGRSEEALRAMVGRREAAGLLVIKSPERAELVVTRDPVWLPQLKSALTASVTSERLARLQVAPDRLAAALAPVNVSLSYHSTSGRKSDAGARIIAAVGVSLTLLGLLLGMANLFAGITGEKQQRVTEQVVAAVSPQTWVDGKLLGLCGVAMASVCFYGLAVAVLVGTPRVLNGTLRLGWPSTPPSVFLLFLLLSMLGFLFWFTFFAILAVTIDDPYTSARGALLYVPFLPMGLAVVGMRHPDSPAMRALSLIPGTSPTFMSVRLALGEVVWWEPALAIALLVISVAAFRRAAGKIFGAAMMTYGKEPGIGEMLRWIRQA